ERNRPHPDPLRDEAARRPVRPLRARPTAHASRLRRHALSARTPRPLRIETSVRSWRGAARRTGQARSLHPARRKPEKEPWISIQPLAIELSQKLIAHPLVGCRIRRIAWIEAIDN